jgi:hypothetical protein
MKHKAMRKLSCNKYNSSKNGIESRSNTDAANKNILELTEII